MLIIRPEQLQRLDEYAEEEFIKSLMANVREVHGELVEDLDDKELYRFVKVAVARARSHGLTYESSIGAFVGLMFEFAPNFDEQPAIRKMLSDERLPPDDRIDLVVEAASEQDWTEAELLYDDNAWLEPNSNDDGQQ